MLRFGTAGIPLSTKPYNTINGIIRVDELGLQAMELEFVRNVNVSKQLAPKAKKLAKEKDVMLTAHASYFINLASKEEAKREASRKRLLLACERAYECGAFSVCFHAGFYQGRDKREIYEIIKKELEKVIEELEQKGIKIWVRPETTGKGTQFGSLNELISLSKELENVLPCVDFAHLHARSNGKFNSYEEFAGVLEKLEKELGNGALRNMHIHVSGIEYSDKGERFHLNLKDSDLKYRELLKALKDFKCEGVLISESPNIEEDALLMQKTYHEL